MQNSSIKPKSNLLKLSVTLFLIAGIMALLVAFVNNVTEPVIKQRNDQQISDALKTVVPNAETFSVYKLDITSVKSSDGKDVAVEGAWRAYKGSEEIGVCVKVAPQGYGGPIEMIVGVSSDGKIIDAEIVSMSETSGIGTKIQDENFLSQFVGKTKGITISSSSSENSVQVVSGATKSSKAYIRGMNAALDVANKVLGGADDD